ncbi:MAG: hypothetical protein JWQ34_1292 [Mucilaginibacter sp.]|uniref:hypothetical protein n=1 Tax=Mucilaginibacter sp. TaxID=1882438 RepID=UPI0026260D9C|nr:hypothetical protein [Mucilaginibacter sp.]MDB5003067.1 hypothetical protein [Mucilaginibacter sp.]
MPVKIKQTQQNKSQWVDYENYFHNYINNDLYETLQIKDVYELYNRISGQELWQTTLEKKAAIEALNKHPDIFRIEYSDKNTIVKPREKPKPTSQYEQTGSELILESIREAQYAKISEKSSTNIPSMSNKDEKAIALFEAQKLKIDAFPNSDDQFWRDETLGLVEKFIGKETSQYGLLSSHTFWPNPKAINVETEESQRERGRKMIDLCISHIKAHGIKIEPSPQPIINYNTVVHSGNLYQDLSRDNQIKKHKVKMNNPSAISKSPIIEKWGLWVAIASGVIALLTGLKTCGI